ncbi:hypothetical protein ACP4OV_010071 [Aristida adscensionis]
MMILAPHDSPNTDGIDPDSSSNVCIEDSYISTSDDLVAIKSGWDEYGIAYGRPSSGITIRRVRGSSPFSGIAIGSEASGGVSDVLVEDCSVFDSGVGIHIKTTVGRGGYIRNVTVDTVRMRNVRSGDRIAGDAGDHPDGRYSRQAVPAVDGVRIRNVWGVGVQQPGSLEGIRDAPFTRICLDNVKLYGWRLIVHFYVELELPTAWHRNDRRTQRKNACGARGKGQARPSFTSEEVDAFVPIVSGACLDLIINCMASRTEVFQL